MVWKVFGQPGKFPDSQDNFWMVWKVFGQPGYFPEGPDIFQLAWIAWKVSEYNVTSEDFDH